MRTATSGDYGARSEGDTLGRVSLLDKLKGRAQAIVRKHDGWINEWTGLGTYERDRAAHTMFRADPWLDDQTLATLYHQDDIACTIVSAYPEEALSRGWVLNDPVATQELERLRARDAFEEAATWGRLYGGGVVVIGTDDPFPSTDPLPAGKFCVKFLKVYDKREVHREVAVSDPSSPDWGRAQILRIQPGNGATFYVHRTRCLIFGGQKTGDQEREQRQGWDASVLQAALSNMLTDASQGVLKMKGLVAAMTGEDDIVVKARLALIDMSRSIARSVFLDADGNESYERVQASFSDIPETADRFGIRLATAARIPVTKLLGMSPAGMNATGESDLENWWANVRKYRKHEIEPHLKRLLVVLGHPGLDVVWPPFREESAEKRTARAKTEADIDNVYAQIGTITPEEIFASPHVRARYPEARAELRTATPAVQNLTAIGRRRNSNPALAADMTNAIPPARHCEHGRANFCDWCGVERTRKFTRMPDGSDQWTIAWRALDPE
jgi:phage-related protein (TIGR01555 family)